MTPEELKRIKEDEEYYNVRPLALGEYGQISAIYPLAHIPLPQFLWEALQKKGGRMTVKDIVKEHLVKNRFDGLCTEACGCFLDNLMPCEGGMENCVPGYEGKDEDGERGVFEEKQGVKKESK